MEATQCLRDEHQVILRVLDCFDLALQQARQAGKVSREVFEPFVEFFRGFADQCHHCKEEDRLFPCMERQGVPREGGPIGVLLEEHRRGRHRVTMMAEELQAADAGDPISIQTVLEQGQKFLELLRGHIEKEDHCVFGMADQLIGGADLANLTDEYRQAENEPEYCARLSRCRAVADRLIEKYGVGRG
ncbi:MAG: hemerythrin domain-containing protein [Planctomycetota bacterium]|jgi:hemerythrin-like domain-containing protein